MARRRNSRKYLFSSGVPSWVTKGHRHPSPPASHASGSAGYHSDLSIPGYQPQTPTVAPPPGEGAKGPAGRYPGAAHEYSQAITALPPALRPTQAPPAPEPDSGSIFSTISGLLTPGGVDALSPRHLAEAADHLGVKPLIEHAGQEIGKGAAFAADLPHLRVDSFQGHPTLGTPTVGQVVKADKQGKLALNARGKVTVPATRHAARKLANIRAVVARQKGPLPGLGPEEEKIANTVLKIGRKMGASRKELLSAIDTGIQESGFRNLPIGAETSGGWRQERALYYPEPTNVKAGARNYFKEAAEAGGGAGETPGELSQTIQRSAYPASSTYSTHEGEARQILAAFNRGQATPQQRQALAVAKQQARAVGINPTPFNGDVEGNGGPKFVLIRADAKGMVNWAKSALGTQEGSPKQLRWASAQGLSGSQPWCANFVSNGLARRGVPLPPNPNYVGSYETEWSGGHNIGTDLSKAKPGDLIAFSAEHIGVYVGGGEMISGNFGNEVARSSVAAGPAPISAILRPNYHGGKVKVSVAAPVPGSTPESAFAGPGGTSPAVGGAQNATTPGRGGRPAAAPLAVGGEVPVSELLRTLALAPQVGRLNEDEEGPGSGTIARILARKRL